MSPTKHLFYFIILHLSFMFAVYSAYASDKITIATGEWSPYTSQIPISSGEEDQHVYGIATDIVSAVIHDMKKQPKYQFSTWEAIENNIKSGKILYSFPYLMTEKRKQHFYFSEPLIKTKGALFFNIHHLKKIPAINNPEDLSQYKLALIKGYAYPSLSDVIKKNNLTLTFNTEIEAFQALIAGKVDIIPLDIKVGDHILSRYFVNDKHKIDRLSTGFFKSKHLHLLASKNSQQAREFIQHFNQSLNNIHNNGVYKAIIAKYQHKTSELFTVRLVGTSSYPMINGTVFEGDNRGYLIPNGTKAAVMQWNRYFTEAGKFNASKEMFEKTKILLLEGPLKGQELWVPNMFLSFK